MASLDNLLTLALIVSFLCLWAVWSFGLKPSLTDSFRQRIFEIRDEMFDYAADGNIDFNHPAYGTIRTLMNGYIRFAHRIDLLFIVLVLLFERKKALEAHAQFTAKLEARMYSLDDEKKGKLREYLHRVQIESAKHLLFTSPLLMVLFPFLLLVAAMAKMFGHIPTLKKEIIKRTEKIRLLDHMAFSEAKRRSA